MTSVERRKHKENMQVLRKVAWVLQTALIAKGIKGHCALTLLHKPLFLTPHSSPTPLLHNIIHGEYFDARQSRVITVHAQLFTGPSPCKIDMLYFSSTARGVYHLASRKHTDYPVRNKATLL